jgi:hypothetical protein
MRLALRSFAVLRTAQDDNGFLVFEDSATEFSEIVDVNGEFL